MAGSGDDVEAEVVADVEAAGLGHVLLQKGVLLPPQQQDGRAYLARAERQEAAEILCYITLHYMTLIRCFYSKTTYK